MAAEGAPTILVVDDNPASRYATSRILRAAGFTILEAGTGSEGLALAQDADLVVLDVNLPDIDGFQVCRQLRSRPETFRLPVLHLSATFVKDVDKVQGLESGADGYLTHPVEPPVLIATVNAFLRTRQAEDAMRRSEARFKAVFDQALIGIALVNEEMAYLEVNPAMCAILRRPREEIVGRRNADFLPAGDEDQTLAIARELETRGAWHGTFPLVRSDGKRVELDWNVSIHSVPGVRLATVKDVTERRAIEAERERLLASERTARAEAERANRLKDEFLATLSHELRTPLTAILLWTKMLRSGKVAPDEHAEVFETIERSAVAQQQLIEDLLDAARMMSGKLRLNVRDTELARLVHAAVDAVRPMAEAKGVEVEFDPEDGVPRVRVDPDRVQQVVWNLVNNGVKFTGKGGRVRVTLRRVNGAVRVQVADTGQGMSREFLPFVFERFRQADATTTRSHGGLGLGLAIARQLVELHGGTIRVDSEGEGRGSTFTVELPLAGVPFEAVDEPDHAAAAVATVAAEAMVTTPRLNGVRVLLVEDEADAREVVRRLLEQFGAEVRAVESAAEALAAFRDALKGDRFHVLVSDIGLPVQDGYALVREVREIEKQRGATGPLPAAALTAYARDDDRARARAAGFQAHVAKPVEPHVLVTAVADLAAGNVAAGQS